MFFDFDGVVFYLVVLGVEGVCVFVVVEYL